MAWPFNHYPTPDIDGDVRRVTSHLRFRAKYGDPHLFPSGWSEEQRNDYLLWQYVQEIRRFWRVRARAVRPPLRWRIRKFLHVGRLVWLGLNGELPDDDGGEK